MMNITLFNKKYWVRRFGEQRVVRGYVTSGRSDFIASLHVHPQGGDQQQALPEGERRIVRLAGHGNINLVVANQETGVKGDLLYYFGEWYECVSSQLHHDTMLTHWNYSFTIVPKDGAKSVDLDDEPTDDPSKYSEGYERDKIDMPIATDTVIGGVIIPKGSGLCIDSDGYLFIDGATIDDIRAMFGGENA